jgi:hypothetical protein
VIYDLDEVQHSTPRIDDKMMNQNMPMKWFHKRNAEIHLIGEASNSAGAAARLKIVGIYTYTYIHIHIYIWATADFLF